MGGWFSRPDDDEDDDQDYKRFHSVSGWQLHFNEFKESDQLMVVFFSARWSDSCFLIQSHFAALASKYPDVDFVKIDVDELKAMPTFVFIKRGEEKARIVGVKDDLEKEIKNHI
uniref:thioredoxin H2-like isoform X2 n=1 Tax=Erigeron canadensis TaxID=72917 RepID=UPI001CB95611|nr:thioredoxin H2-like isoform X2 [Erigeron canadensis]